MTREQRLRYDTFVRVSGFGIDHKELFPESSAGSDWFKGVTATVEAIDRLTTERVFAQAEARKIKVETRRAVEQNMSTIAGIARRMALTEPETNRFIKPRQKSLQAVLSTARAFAEEGTRRQDLFVRYGLPATFMSEFQILVNNLEAAAETRQMGKTMRSEARAGIETALRNGLELIRNLEHAVEVATRQNPALFAAWKTARRVEGQNPPHVATAKASQAASTADAPAVPS